VNLAAPIPFWVVGCGIVALAAIFLIGVFFVKNHPKANKEKR